MPSYYGLISRGALNDIREVTVFCSDLYLVDHIISLKKFKFKWSNNELYRYLFFEKQDRELPRLIRGRVHRCVGNYDQKKNIFKCVSVRPASASEQKTFQAFVKIVDAEMRYYTSVMNEV